MPDPVLLFGIGATKAGTSWLHHYLSAHPECALRSIKELHFFDTMDDRGAHAWYLRDLDAKAEALSARVAEAPDEGRIIRLAELRAYRRVLKRHDEAAYLDFVEGARDEERVVGDITPAYGLLPADRLAHMARLRDDVRFVYLMRDPVDRLWSHVRMVAKRQRADGDFAAKAAALLDRVLAGEEDHITIRGDYRAVLEKLAISVAPERTFVATCEDLFEGDALARLCAFLGIGFVAGERATRVHAGEAAALRPEQRARAAEFLRPQYDFVAERMGRLPPAWDAHRTRV